MTWKIFRLWTGFEPTTFGTVGQLLPWHSYAWAGYYDHWTYKADPTHDRSHVVLVAQLVEHYTGSTKVMGSNYKRGLSGWNCSFFFYFQYMHVYLYGVKLRSGLPFWWPKKQSCIKRPSTQDLSSPPTSLTCSFAASRALSWLHRWKYNGNLYMVVYMCKYEFVP